MSERSKDELLEAQKEVIGILFEIVKRYQANNELDEEYFQIVANENKKSVNKKRLEKILFERSENGKIVTRLLEKLNS
ncbi:MAG: hydrolase [Nitrosopumilaceae archaeon]|jgi:hypothetical protein